MLVIIIDKMLLNVNFYINFK